MGVQDPDLIPFKVCIWNWFRMNPGFIGTCDMLASEWYTPHHFQRCIMVSDTLYIITASKVQFIVWKQNDYGFSLLQMFKVDGIVKQFF